MTRVDTASASDTLRGMSLSVRGALACAVAFASPIWACSKTTITCIDGYAPTGAGGACEPIAPDTGPRDASVFDAGAADSGPADAGLGDAGAPDGESPDGGATSFALHFDGSGDQIAFPMSFGEVGDRFTFEAWVRPASASSGSSEGEGGMIFIHRADCRDFILEWSGNVDGRTPERFRFRVHDTSACASAAAEAPMASAVDTWHHVAGVFDAGMLHLFVDGALVASATLAATAPTWADALFGHWAGRDGYDPRPERGAFNGDIDELRISRIARYASEFVPDTHLGVDAETVALWMLDEGTASLAYDSSPSALHGVVSGATWIPAGR